MSFFGPIPDHARRHISRTALLHAPGITLSALKPIRRSAPLPSIVNQSLWLGRSRFSQRSVVAIAAIATTTTTAALHASERALVRSGSSMRYDAEFAVSRKPDQPLSDGGDVEHAAGMVVE
jgi:hypothetical protein